MKSKIKGPDQGHDLWRKDSVRNMNMKYLNINEELDNIQQLQMMIFISIYKNSFKVINGNIRLRNKE